VSAESVARDPVSGRGSIRWGKPNLFRGPLISRTLQARLTVASEDGQVYILARAGFRERSPGPEGIMLGGLLFIVCVVLQFHYHDSLPWYIWVVAVIALCVSFGEPAMRSAIKAKKE
jgi:hypothetical protein